MSREAAHRAGRARRPEVGSSVTCPTLSDFANFFTVAAAVFAFALYGKARHSTRVAIKEHLDIVGSWAAGPRLDSSGWTATDFDLNQKITWLSPTKSIYRIGSGAALLQTTLGDSLTLGDELTQTIVHLNQRIESYHSALIPIDTLRVTNSVKLFQFQLILQENIHHLGVAADPTDHASFLRQIDRKTDLFKLYQLTKDDFHMAATLIYLTAALYSETIGTPTSNGLCEWSARAVRAFERDR